MEILTVIGGAAVLAAVILSALAAFGWLDWKKDVDRQLDDAWDELREIRERLNRAECAARRLEKRCGGCETFLARERARKEEQANG